MEKHYLIGKTVLVGEPKSDDLHNHEFQGTVVGVRGDIISVEDQDGDVFDVDLDNVTVEE